uniref:Small ribosomal subunit protein uS4c n=1 Tax=Pleurocladia lacustris TaxID=246121 RepID=A0A1I9LVU0_9PHAE|nr:30S ribosomal protein S4 [Pleurocladia lacustris]ANS57566.1 30S ribosomal protein S4 [Pleurocladia lacustris]ANS57710.1 30S ribosomal protein S4 [Pleurocladia lacustris]
MVRYRGPRLKIINRLGDLPGLTRKVVIKQEASEKTQQKKAKASPYKIRLNEKQKLRYNYGITESQLLRYVKEARRRKGLTGFLLMQLLEMRLDNIIFRLGLAPTIPAARQFVSHGHVMINKKRVNIPSFQCQPNDIITFSKKPKTITLIKLNLNRADNSNLNDNVSNSHLEFDSQLLTGKILNLIQRNDLRFKINDMLVIEYYSRLV